MAGHGLGGLVRPGSCGERPRVRPGAGEGAVVSGEGRRGWRDWVGGLPFGLSVPALSRDLVWCEAPGRARGGEGMDAERSVCTAG